MSVNARAPLLAPGDNEPGTKSNALHHFETRESCPNSRFLVSSFLLSLLWRLVVVGTAAKRYLLVLSRLGP